MNKSWYRSKRFWSNIVVITGGIGAIAQGLTLEGVTAIGTGIMNIALLLSSKGDVKLRGTEK